MIICLSHPSALTCRHFCFRADVRQLVVGPVGEETLLLLQWSRERVQLLGRAANRPSGPSVQGDRKHMKWRCVSDDIWNNNSVVLSQDEVGGQRTLQNKWTSFAKAPLVCQLPKQLPFNILQDVFTLQPPEGGNASDTLFYGVFTSQWYEDKVSPVITNKTSASGPTDFVLYSVRVLVTRRLLTSRHETQRARLVFIVLVFNSKVWSDGGSAEELGGSIYTWSWQKCFRLKTAGVRGPMVPQY